MCATRIQKTVESHFNVFVMDEKGLWGAGCHPVLGAETVTITTNTWALLPRTCTKYGEGQSPNINLNAFLTEPQWRADAPREPRCLAHSTAVT